MTVYIQVGDIDNKSFETGNFTGWDISAPPFEPIISSARAHTGTYSVFMDEPFGVQWMEQELDNVPVDSLSTFGYWKNGEWSLCFGGAISRVTITYSDATTTTINHTTSQSEEDVWTYVDIFTYLTSGKIMTKIKIECRDDKYIYIDDVSYTGIECDPIFWQETQICDVATRSVPTRSTGAKVDTGTYVLKPRDITMEIRLSDSEKTVLQDIYDADVEILLIAVNESGTWTYYTWFKHKPLFYQYAHQEDTTREWRTKLSFVCYTFNYV